MMDLNRLTQKSQEALAAAQDLATRAGHTEVDGEHLLLALLDQPDGLVSRLITAMGADAPALRRDLEAELARKPRTTRPATQPGQVSVTQRLARLLVAVDRRRRQRITANSVQYDRDLLAYLWVTRGTPGRPAFDPLRELAP